MEARNKKAPACGQSSHWNAQPTFPAAGLSHQ